MLKRITKPDATVAITYSGVLPYFSDRAATDMRGKNDKKIERKMRQLSADSKV
jgi:hypothetical protein